MDYTDTFLEKSKYYREEVHDLQLALKNAYIAASSSFCPRADVCCFIGDIYLEMSNLEWARNWFKLAINNVSASFNEEISGINFQTTIPFLKLAYIEYNMGNDEEAKTWYESVLKLEPNNDIALDGIKTIEEKK